MFCLEISLAILSISLGEFSYFHITIDRIVVKLSPFLQFPITTTDFSLSLHLQPKLPLTASASNRFPKH